MKFLQDEVKKAGEAAKEAQEQAMKFLQDEVKKAGEAAKEKFGAAREKMANNRAEADQNLATATNNLNDALAKQAALADSRFWKTVKSIAEARKQAADEVADSGNNS